MNLQGYGGHYLPTPAALSILPPLCYKSSYTSAINTALCSTTIIVTIILFILTTYKAFPRVMVSRREKLLGWRKKLLGSSGASTSAPLTTEPSAGIFNFKIPGSAQPANA
jgi:hypothetical protein